jgi:hydroxymethylbilane synthase
MNARLHGGCQVPIAGFATLDGEGIQLRGLVGTPDGSRILRAEAEGSRDAPEALGTAVAEALLAQGAAEILATLHEPQQEE